MLVHYDIISIYITVLFKHMCTGIVVMMPIKLKGGQHRESILQCGSQIKRKYHGLGTIFICDIVVNFFSHHLELQFFKLILNRRTIYV